MKTNRAIFPLIELSLDRSKPGWLVEQLEKNKHKDKRQQKIFLEHFVNTFFCFTNPFLFTETSNASSPTRGRSGEGEDSREPNQSRGEKNKIAHFLMMQQCSYKCAAICSSKKPNLFSISWLLELEGIRIPCISCRTPTWDVTKNISSTLK